MKTYNASDSDLNILQRVSFWKFYIHWDTVYSWQRTFSGWTQSLCWCIARTDVVILWVCDRKFPASRIENQFYTHKSFLLWRAFDSIETKIKLMNKLIFRDKLFPYQVALFHSSNFPRQHVILLGKFVPLERFSQTKSLLKKEFVQLDLFLQTSYRLMGGSSFHLSSFDRETFVVLHGIIVWLK